MGLVAESSPAEPRAGEHLRGQIGGEVPRPRPGPNLDSPDMPVVDHGERIRVLSLEQLGVRQAAQVRSHTGPSL